MDVELLAGLISEVDPSIGEKDLRPYRSPLNKYAARVFDSLAEILISEPSGEVVAVGIQRDERKVIFTVAINRDMMPAHMHDHLITLWGLLKEISDGYHQDRVKYMALTYQYRAVQPTRRNTAEDISLHAFDLSILVQGIPA